MIDWSKLKSYHNTKNRSFEELCYQIAKGCYGHKGSFTPIDDSGGGDGVEFYMTSPNGEQCGWQAKFYYPGMRLSDSNRKASIINSLKVACKNHPHMKKWILCTPTKFTSGEQSWLEDTLPKSIPTNMKLEIKHWGDSDFNMWLSEPRFRGKKNYFFGDLELTIDWFDTQLKKQIIQNKFIDVLHTETNVDATIHNILGDQTSIQSIDESLTFVRGKLDEFRQAIENIDRPIPSLIEWGNYKSNLINPAKSLQNAFSSGFKQVQQALNLLCEGSYDEFYRLDLDLLLDKIYKSYRAYNDALSTLDVSNLVYLGKEDDRDEALDEARDIISGPAIIIGKLLNGPLYSAIDQLKFLNYADLHILGAAGIGKTHTVSNICNERLKFNLPCLLILGVQFTGDSPLQKQLLNILDVPETYSWSDFLQALETAAMAYHTRIPLIIDGLNEAMRNGAFSDVWRLGLAGLIQEISQTKNIALITTCRTTYKEAIWSKGEPKHVEYAFGFKAYDVEAAIKKYFSWYKIKADLTAAPLSQFQHPIYLKMFCESQNAARQEEKQIFIGDYTLFEVFDSYLEHCNSAICKRLGLYYKTPVLMQALDAVSKYLWNKHSRKISLTKMVELLDSQPLGELNWEQSKTKAILDEGLLVCRDWHEDEEAVYFSYDLLGGYLIAYHLVQQNVSDIESFIQSDEILMSLFSDNFDSLHPLHEDISRSLAALLPVEIGKYLHELTNDKKAFNFSITALFEISPNDVNQNGMDIISKLFTIPKNQKQILKLSEPTVCHVNHPLNASFWSKQLQVLPMSERDISWTEYVRENVETFEKTVLSFEAFCKNDKELAQIATDRNHLLAEYVMWLLTSTVRPLRDKATRALYWYGRKWPERFIVLVLKSLKINDPYISERMLAATYGVAMALQYDFKDSNFTKEILPSYGRKLYESMFKSHASYATTHILARDYAKRIIDISLKHHPDLLTLEERKRITPPFIDGGIRDWGQSEDKHKGEYRDGNAPIQMDFENYTLGQLVKDRQNYDYENEEYKIVRANIFWRIYDMGYSLKIFSDIDKIIASRNWYYERATNQRKTDRYGKKYSWIAFYELAGFRQDQGLLNELYCEKVRISDADIDPSFPQPVQEFLIIDKDLLGDRNIPLDEWIENGNAPDISAYFVLEELYGENGPWVLLDGDVSQEDLEAKRSCFIYPRGLFVQKNDLNKVMTSMKKQNAREQLHIAEDYYTYAGEIPWCDTFSYNGQMELEFVISTKKKKINLPSLFGDKGIPQEIEVPDKKKIFNVFIPVRTNYWEEYHSSVNTGRSVLVPAKEIAEYLDLCSQPQTFDLYEKNGKRASITIRVGEHFHTGHHLIFLRQDLLNRYLLENNLDLMWVVWGERQCRSKNNAGLDEFAKKHEPFRMFQEIKLYEETIN